MNLYPLPRLTRILALAGLALLVMTAPTDSQELPRDRAQVSRGEVVILGRDFILKENETCRDVVVIGGNVTIEGKVEGDLVVVFGSVRVTGHVEGSMVVVMGGASIGESGRVDDEIVLIGRKLEVEPGAKVSGTRNEIVLGNWLPDLQWIGEWVSRGLLMARPLAPQFQWAWVIAVLFLIIYMLLAALFPKPAEVCVQALVDMPAGSFFAGVLAFALIGPLIFLLVISVAGIPVIPVLLFAMGAAVLFGKMAVYRATGERLGAQFNVPILANPIAALIVGLGIFYVLYMIPVVGFMAWTVAAVWGLGAVLVAAFASFRSEARPPAPLAIGPAPAPATSASPVTLAANVTPGSPSTPAAEPAPILPPQTAVAPQSAAAVSYQRAGFWIRFVATLLDFVVLFLLMTLFRRFFLLVWIAYHVGMWTWRGTTVGGIVMGLKLVRTNGEPVDFPIALVRSLASFFSALPLFIGFFWVGWDPQRQSWHDKIAGTVMVRVPKGALFP